MSKEELETYKQKVWCDLEDYMKIAQCGRNTALKGMREVRNRLREENYILPIVKLLPMKNLLEHLGIGE